ncbi:MAG: hypothetical protein DGJ47_000063 [Rickettsiaceae bacterium]
MIEKIIFMFTEIYFVAIFFIILALILAIKMYQLHNIIDQKNIELIKYHLDTKFICKNLLESLSTSDPNIFCSEFIKKIQDYYYLEDLIIIDSLKMNHSENKTVLRRDVVSYIRNNTDTISYQLSSKNLVNFQFHMDDKCYNIHISRISAIEGCEGLVVCVEKSPSLLAAQERNSLENSINLLKNRLFYS